MTGRDEAAAGRTGDDVDRRDPPVEHELHRVPQTGVELQGPMGEERADLREDALQQRRERVGERRDQPGREQIVDQPGERAPHDAEEAVELVPVAATLRVLEHGPDRPGDLRARAGDAHVYGPIGVTVQDQAGVGAQIGPQPAQDPERLGLERELPVHPQEDVVGSTYDQADRR